jgi:Protein of unknown function (DUF1688)
VHIAALFHALIQGLAPIWPVRNQLAGISLGDVWSCNALVSEPSTGIPAGAKFNPSSQDRVADDLVPFHKLTQWLTYSLVEPLEKILGWTVEGMEDMTGLPEYRNGGEVPMSRLSCLRTLTQALLCKVAYWSISGC